MNVKELRAALADLPDELMVVVGGYEEGVNEVAEVEHCKIKLNTGLGTRYVGDHSVIHANAVEPGDGAIIDAVQLL